MATVVNETVHAVHGNTSLVLDKPGVAWIVKTGSVAVFGVRLEDGSPSGPRRFLFTCSVGDYLFGGMSDSTASEGFVVVGLADSQLREVQLESLAAADLATLESAVGDWVAKVGAMLATVVAPAYADRIESGQVSLDTGQAVKPPTRGIRWVRVLEGRISVVGLSECEFGPEDGWLAASDRLWLRAEAPSELLFEQTAAIEEADSYAQGLSLLHEYCFRAVAGQLAEETKREAIRLGERRRLQQIDTKDAIGRMLSILSPEKVHEIRDTPLLTALAAIEPDLGVTFRSPAASEDMACVEHTIEAVARSSHIRLRRVTLASNWWKRDGGPILAYRGTDARPVALLRKRRWFGLFTRYEMFDPVEQTQVAVNRTIDESLAPEAVTFVRPLPAEKTSSAITMMGFTVGRIWLDVAMLVVLAVLASAVGMVQPMATRVLIDKVIPDADMTLLYQMAIGLFAMAVGTTSFAISKGLVSIRISTLATSALQSGVFDRLLRLPQSFFRKYSTGDLANRAMMVNEVAQEVNGAALNGMLSGLMSLLNLYLCYKYSPDLAWIAVATALITALAAVAFSIPIRKKALALERLNGLHNGLSVQLINGISKLRVSGAEQRAFNFWTRGYAKQLGHLNSLQVLDNWSGLINTALETGSMTFLFFAAAKGLQSGGASTAATTMLTMGTFLAFYGAFKTLVGGMVSFTNTFVDIMDSWAKRELIKPLLDAKPESDESSVDPGVLTGHVALDEVVFRYTEDGPLILNGVSLEARPGDFVALVGSSGCGKSTIFKLLLGFDAAESGKVYYDNQDLDSLDKAAVRRQLGIVIQSGRINAGPIFEAIAAGSLITLDEAWEAARDAGFDDEIKAMPMGMHTVLSEGASTLSGGQRQRLLIARALARNPRILLFDEATSALDNRTQEIVSHSLERRKVTRLVIAHRLSTIQDADRIYVLDAGHVVQSGTFDALMQQEGLFKRLASRQMV